MSAIEAAQRLRNGLEEAKAGRYYNDAWYFYLRRPDVEEVVSAVLDSSGEEAIVETEAGEVVKRCIP